MGDFNAKVGDKRVEDVAGRGGIGTVSAHGSKLIEWCQINDFTILHNSGFGGASLMKYNIDYNILTQKLLQNSIKTKSLTDSDHVPIVVNLK
ncbi:craniofacial development protein 2-like [Plakobranchus ocellatus]|uniref:Craniofacial development protein 2-like n=1 Tax=Plakobranchus ocellatus TaxID=259542 RepID=A0AAV4A093_9GAST|nr:craniofacial development protein 2-like [Plakobranchus ocellatus]